MRCNFLAHFNYANCVYVETNSHCLPAHVCLLSLSHPPSLSLSRTLFRPFSLSLSLSLCVHYRIMQTKRRRWAQRCAAKEMRISFSISNRHSHSPTPPTPSLFLFLFLILIRMHIPFAWASMLYMQLTWLATTNNPIVGKNQ